jgi:HAD superfamily hydrolase (TIGR01484 family)
MSRTHYDKEIDSLGATYKAAMQADVGRLKEAIAGASESSVIGVGSGGSFTVASLLCNLHETYTGRVSRPSTPLEIICNPTLAASSPVFLISAEGKNPDITEALQRARRHSARTVHVLTNRQTSPLMECVAELTDVGSHVFELTEKDGYLATNSLLMDAVLVARAYGELDRTGENLPAFIDDLSIESGTVDEWISGADRFAKEVVSRRGLIVVYAPSLRAIAIDLESKLSESALMYVQIADIRSFAHGRHIWLAERPSDCAVLALIEPALSELWKHMRGLIPPEVPCLNLSLSATTPQHLIAALIAGLKFVGLLAKYSAKDLGRPNVPDFGRNLYYADLPKLVSRPEKSQEGGVQTKFEVIGARWPYVVNPGPMQRARDAFKNALERQMFRAIVFDYDGTLCTSQRKDAPPSLPIAEEITRLTQAGIVVAIVSGRGGSMRDRLREAVPHSEWARVHLGLYNGGWITDLAAEAEPPAATSEFLNHVSRIVGQLKIIGVPIEHVKPSHPYQVSVRFREGVETEAMWFVIADALRQAGLDLSTMVRSKHSVDILAPKVGKSQIVARLIQQHHILPHQVLAMGDQGAWPGNDSALLEHRFSLSVDFPSRRLDRGWKLAPPHRRAVDATLWYLDRLHVLDNGYFRIECDQPRSSTGAPRE